MAPSPQGMGSGPGPAEKSSVPWVNFLNRSGTHFRNGMNSPKGTR